MGIKNLNSFLNKTYPDLVKKVNIDMFYGKRVAIDGHNWIYTTMAHVQKRMLNDINPMEEDLNRDEFIYQALTNALDFIMTWFGAGITPVFVFDGKSPVEKNETKQERYEKKLKLQDEIAAIKDSLSKRDKLEITPSMIDELRSKMRQCINIQSSDWKAFFTLIKDLGVPFYEAEGDGEKLCCMLCLEGKVEAVYSADSDNLAYGCPIIITGPLFGTFNYKTRQLEHTVSMIQFKDVIQSLNMTYPEFLDFCILCSCDYNTNIPNVGVVKALKLVEKYRNIEDIPDEYDKTCLNHVRCRELFKYQPSNELFVTGHLNLELDQLISTGKDFLLAQQLISFYPKLISIYNRIPKPSNVFVSKSYDDISITITETTK